MCKKVSESKKISVIVPVYNAEKYINRCVKSIVDQNYSNWELILVDDGSKDNSSRILDDWAKKDSRISIIHQTNTGPGLARNKGIKAASGEFIVFVDADDYLDPMYFAFLSPKMEYADIVFIDVLQVDLNGHILSKELMSSYKEWGQEKVLRAQMTGKIPWGGVRKAVCRKLLLENKIFYTRHSIGEEALYSMKLLLFAKKIAFIDEKPVYYYVNHDGSQSKIKIDDPWGGVVSVIKDYLNSQGLIGKYGNTVNAFSATATIVSIDRLCMKYRNDKLLKSKIRERIFFYKRNVIRNVGMDYQSMDYKVLLLYPFLKIGWIFPIILISKIRKGMRNEN